MAYFLLYTYKIKKYGVIMDNKLLIDDIQIIESEEFSSLLQAIEIMAKAQGDLSHLTKAVSELKSMVDNSVDSLPITDSIAIDDIVETMQNLVDDLQEEQQLDI